MPHQKELTELIIKKQKIKIKAVNLRHQINHLKEKKKGI